MRSIRNCNVCVVGGAGFLGSHMVDHLIEDRDCKVLVIDNLCAGRSEFINRKAAFEHHDITGNESLLLEAFSEFKMTGSASRGVDYVFNYAAMPYIPDSFRRPLRVFDINTFGALKVINAAQEAGCKGILQVSSAEIYGEGHPEFVQMVMGPGESDGHFVGRCTEKTEVVPHSSYGASKAAIDALVQVRWREAKTPVIALRQFNCVGARETHRYVVPEIISQLGALWNDTWVPFEDKVSPTVRLGNNSFRDFMYAGDAVRMAAELLEKGDFGEVYNLGSESGIKIYDLAKKIGLIMGFNGVQIITDESRVRPYEIWHLQSDNAKIYATIEARPEMDLDEALARTVDSWAAQGKRWVWEQSTTPAK